MAANGNNMNYLEREEREENIITWQLAPTNPVEHLQLGLLSSPSTHVPPFAQTMPAHNDGAV